MGAPVLAEQPSAPLSQEERRRRWREVWAMYLGMTALTVAVGWIGVLWSPLASLSALIVAMGFMFLPIEWLHRRGENVKCSGIGGRSDLIEESMTVRALRSSRQALKVSLIVFPLYLLGAHAWHNVQGHEATWDARAFTRWSEEVRGTSSAAIPRGSIRLEARADQIKVSWRLSASERTARFKIELSDGSYHVLNRSKTARLESSPSVIQPSKAVQEFYVRGHGYGWVQFKTRASAFKLTTHIDGVILKDGRLKGGAFDSSLSLTSAGVFETERDHSWLWSIFLIQLFLVGLPEEIFYRGYLQTRLDSLIGEDRVVFGVPFNFMSATVCSALFALAHLVTIPHLGRLAVFFPSLLFGWMRRAYHDTLPPAIFHALCNILAQLIWGVYVLG